MRRGMPGPRSTITSGRSRCRRRSPGTPRNCRTRILVGGTAATLAFELVIVFLIFLPRRPRAFAAWCVLLFQALILVTGNYNFFNLLSMLMCVFLFDDAALRRAFPAWLVALGATPRAAARTPGDGDRVGRRAPRRARWSQRNRADPGARRPARGRRPVAGRVAADDRQPLRIVRRDDDFATRDRDRGIERRPDVARIRVPLQAGAADAPGAVERFPTSRGSTGRCGSPRSATSSRTPGS